MEQVVRFLSEKDRLDFEKNPEIFAKVKTDTEIVVVRRVSGG